MNSGGQPAESNEATLEARAGMKPVTKLLGLSFIAFHLLTLVMAPLSFRARGPSGRSPIVETIARPTNGYGQFIYADRGYAFFAPDPGPSHLIQAAITSEDGTRHEIMIPDLDAQWPRLMYHRHFMLAEYLNEIYQPKGPPRELVRTNREAAQEWVRLRARYEHLRDSILDHLRAVNPRKEVAVRRIEHLVPDLTLYLEEPVSLDDKRLYRVLLDNPVSVGPPVDATTALPRDESAQELRAPNGKPANPARFLETVPVPQPAFPEGFGQERGEQDGEVPRNLNEKGGST